AYDLSQVLRPPGWPFLTDRVEARRFIRQMFVGLFILFSCLNLTMMFSSPRIAVTGVLALDVTFVLVGYEFGWKKPRSVVGKVVTRIVLRAPHLDDRHYGRPDREPLVAHRSPRAGSTVIKR